MRSHCSAKKTLSEKSREESCFIAAKKFCNCLRRQRRLLHSRQGQSIPAYLLRHACMHRCHAQIPRARAAARLHRRDRSRRELKTANRVRRFVEKRLAATSSRVANLFFHERRLRTRLDETKERRGAAAVSGSPRWALAGKHATCRHSRLRRVQMNQACARFVSLRFERATPAKPASQQSSRPSPSRNLHD